MRFFRITTHVKALVGAMVITTFLSGCSESEPSAVEDGELGGKLAVFHAGSLSVPFRKITEAFNKEHPQVEVLLEAAGSRTCARKISDLNRNCDVMASADYTVIDQLLVPDHADWNIRFAMNEMCLVYHKKSRRADEITQDNWLDILADPSVAFGRSDPNADPCGYRAVLTLQLAGIHYGAVEKTERLAAKDLQYIRPKETDLLALLESGTIDYIFLYRSVAQQHGLEFLILPDEVNLKRAELAEKYAKSSVQISGKKPGEKITKTGAPMVYGITIPKNAENPAAALAFVEFILAPDKGMAIMEQAGQPSAVPSPTDSYSQIPDRLKTFAVSEAP